MKFFIKLFLSLLLSSVPTYSFSQSKSTFNGPYAGISLGYNQTSISESNVSWVAASDPTIYTGSNGQNSQSDGVIRGFNFGYDHRIKNFVIGVELGASLPSGTANGIAARDDLTFPQTNVLLTSQTQLQKLFTLKPKFGFIFDESKSMIYGVAGFALGSIKRTVIDVAEFSGSGWWLNNYGASASSTKTQFGYTLGGGIERLITERFSLKLEVNYIDLGNPNFTYSGPYNTSDTSTMNQNVRITNMATTLGLSYKF